MKKLLTKNYLWAVLVFSISLTVYLFTLCPTIYLEDSAEFVTVAHTLGIAHPSGYPLYVLLAKLFTLIIPIGTIAWRVNFMSAFFAALTCAFLFLIIQDIFKQTTNDKRQTIGDDLNVKKLILHYFIPFISSLIFATSLTFWSQAVVAEVYSLNTFFVAIIVYLLLKWAQEAQKQKNNQALRVKQSSNEIKKDKSDLVFLTIIFLYGLSLSNHQMMILLAPVFLIYILLIKKNIFKDYKLILAGAFLFLLGLSLYFYLPLIATTNPDFNWGENQTFLGFKQHVLRQQYDDLKFSLSALFASEKLPLVNSFYNNLLSQFSYLGLPFILFGFLLNYFRNKKIFVLTFGVFLFNSLVIILLRSGEFTFLNEFIFRVYYLPAYIVASIWLAFGLYYLVIILFNFLKKFTVFFRQLILVILILLLLFLPIAYFLNNLKANNRSDFWLAYDWSENAILSLERNAFLMLYNEEPALDSMFFSLTYMQAVERLRRVDVKLVGVTGVKGIFYQARGSSLDGFIDWDEKKRKEELAKYLWEYAKTHGGGSVYLLYPLGKMEDSSLFTRSNGYVYKVYENIEAAKKDEIKIPSFKKSRNIEYEPLKYDLFYSDFLSDYFFAQSSFYLERGNSEMYQKLLLKAIEYDTSPFSFNYQAFVEHRDLWLNN